MWLGFRSSVLPCRRLLGASVWVLIRFGGHYCLPDRASGGTGTRLEVFDLYTLFLFLILSWRDFGAYLVGTVWFDGDAGALSTDRAGTLGVGRSPLSDLAAIALAVDCGGCNLVSSVIVFVISDILE